MGGGCGGGGGWVFFLMIRRPPRSALDRSSAASDVYKRQALGGIAADVQSLSRWKIDQPITLDEGVLFVSYPTLRSMRGDASCLEQIIPVSYTHLRAHETVLDLVCRLLLEKKKQHSST